MSLEAVYEAVRKVMPRVPRPRCKRCLDEGVPPS